MLGLNLDKECTADELSLLVTAATSGASVDPEVVLATLSRLYSTAEFGDHEEYVLITAGAVPEQPGRVRDGMWEWIERVEKRLGIKLEVWGTSGEYLSPPMVYGSVYSSSDFGQTDTGEYYVEAGLAEVIREMAEIHREWRKFKATLENKVG